jgi:hypothetical protein
LNFPSGTYPTNPFTGVADEAPTYGAAPAASGRYGPATMTTTNYTIQGFGKTAVLSLNLTNG